MAVLHRRHIGHQRQLHTLRHTMRLVVPVPERVYDIVQRLIRKSVNIKPKQNQLTTTTNKRQKPPQNEKRLKEKSNELMNAG